MHNDTFEKPAHEESSPDIKNRLYNNLDDTDTLVDYFNIISVNQHELTNLLEQFPTKGDNRILEPLNSLQPVTMSRFPPHDKKDFPLDEGVLMLSPIVSII